MPQRQSLSCFNSDLLTKKAENIYTLLFAELGFSDIFIDLKTDKHKTFEAVSHECVVAVNTRQLLWVAAPWEGMALDCALIWQR